MAVISGEISLSSHGRGHVIDITGVVEAFIKERSISDATMTIFVPGSTASITTVEYEPGLIKDIPEFLEKIAPYRHPYHHHETWHDDNGSSHIQAAFLGPSLTVPCINGKLALGTWQQIVLIDSDTRQRKRLVVVQAVY